MRIKYNVWSILSVSISHSRTLTVAILNMKDVGLSCPFEFRVAYGRMISADETNRSKRESERKDEWSRGIARNGQQSGNVESPVFLKATGRDGKIASM